MTWRDLSLPNREEAWRQLRGLRVAPPGAAASDRGRAETLQAALEQAQQLMDAAENAGYATRPLQLFYAMSQGGRAIAAASPRLPATIQVPDRDNPGQMMSQSLSWKLAGHGIKASNTNQQLIAKVKVHAERTGLLPGVAVALGAECLKPDEKVALDSLWPLLPESHTVPLGETPRYPALSFEGDREALDTPRAYYEARIRYVPNAVRERCGDDREKLKEFLDRYPSLRGWCFPMPEGNPLGWHSGQKYSALSLYWKYPRPGDPEWGRTPSSLKACQYRESEDWWVFPAVGGMTESIHPLLAWWAVLFALSMMARYEPNNWARMIQIDSSKEANAIEHVLDQALDVVPALLLEAIGEAASGAMGH